MNDAQELLADYAQRGSEPAFTELVGKYLNFVYSTALRLAGGDQSLAEDVTQIVFADLARAARKLSRDVQVGGWLHRHTCFVTANALRSERRRQTRERQAVAMNILEERGSDRIEVIAPELDEAMNQLGEGDRLAVILRFFEQRDFSRVGAGLGTTEEAARKRVSRAVEKLHVILTRRGLTLSAAGLGVALGAGLVSSAPARLASQIAAVALAAGGGSFALNVLAGSKIKLACLAAAFAAAVATPVYLGHQTQAALREENRALQAQVESLRAAQNKSPTVPAERRMPSLVPAPADEHRELLRLRGEVGVLRDQLAKSMQAAAAAGAQKPVQGAQTESADIHYSFPSIPMMQLLDVYGSLCGKPIAIAPEVSANGTVWLKNPPGVELTKTQAMDWIQEALKDQRHVSIVTKEDGSLLVVPAPKE